MFSVFSAALGFTNNSATSTVTEFVLLGFPGCQELQRFLFALFFGIYIFTIMGNGIIVCAVRLDQRLHTPMYILLGNFVFLEIWYITSTVPSMLANFLSETKSISFVGCFLQLYFFTSLGTTEAYFLCIMAYDRYLAICRPLHYPTVMTQRFCCILMSLCWVFGFLSYSVSTVQLSQLPFCGPNTIDHFVCDMDPLMALSCAPAPVIEIVFYILSSLIIILTLLYILSSYSLLLTAVLKVPSAAGRQKAFSTCGSHLTVVCLFFGALLAMYGSPTADNPAEMQKIMTLFYSVVTPFLNPLIYSLRNKEMKAALKQVLRIK
ncbi:PREDICTED: olfactory receptor 11H4-like [Ceratotherium simum simum]|uniref:Olfactory receptor n=1 Tax=Ceratotherium simum simum TaxID=73337 RepID=A0ABM0H8X4_CERSS|nr:PREDICTED: olfactory receptor 11H4-like [Ceratotherium simum simum]